MAAPEAATQAAPIGKMDGRRRTVFFTALLAAFIVLYYGSLIALWHGGSGIFTFSHFDYIQGIEPVERATLRHPYAHLPLPFFDLAGVFSWRECRLLGFDVTLHNPCDPMGRLANYSPLLPQLPLERIGIRNIVPAGLALDGGFLLLLLFVLRPAGWTEFGVSALAAVSPTTIFATERANIDVLIFLLLIGAMMLPQSRRWARLVSYIATFTGFLIKFYPVVFLVAMLRERLRLLLPLSIVLLAALIIFFFGYRADLARISTILPMEVTYYEMFGGPIFARSVQSYFHLTQGAGTAIYLCCGVISLWCAAGISERIRRTIPELDLLERRMGLLLCSGVILAACFFLGFSVSYRGIFLLAALPGMFALRGRTGNPAMRKLLDFGLGAALVCLYGDMIRAIGMHGVAHFPGHDVTEFAVFLLRESAWWFEVTLLVGIIIALLRRSMAVIEAMELMSSWRLRCDGATEQE